MQRYLVNTTLEQVAYSKDPHEPPLPPTYQSLPALCPATFEPEMEAIKSMLGDTFEEEETRWPAPKRRTWLSIKCRFIPLPFESGQINFRESDHMSSLGGCGGKGQEIRGEMEFLSSKSGVENVWPLGPYKAHKAFGLALPRQPQIQ